MPAISIWVVEFYSRSTQRLPGKWKKEILSNFIPLVSITPNCQYNCLELHIELKTFILYFFVKISHQDIQKPIKRFYHILLSTTLSASCILTSVRVAFQNTGTTFPCLHGITQTYSAEIFSSYILTYLSFLF